MVKLVAITIFFSSLYSPISAEGPTTAQVKSELELSALNYFLDHAHPVTGLVRDRANNFESTPETNRISSIAATGFGIAVIANAAERGLVGREWGYRYVLKVLKFARDQVPRYKGWFVHMIDWETGKRAISSEFSTIDSAFFLAGALYAAQVFKGTEAAKIAQDLYVEADFQAFLTDNDTKPNKKTLSMAWQPERGFTESQWDMYAEQPVLLILGLGHPTHPLPPETWWGWKRKGEMVPTGELLMGADMPLFVHQYSQLFLDFRNLRDGYPNYFKDGGAATRYHFWIARTDHSLFSFREGFWGLSSCDTAIGHAVCDPGNYLQIQTVCISCMIGSAMFAPDLVLKEASSWIFGSYRGLIWGRYGLADSLDLDSFWFAKESIGITVGAAYLSLANTEEETSIWKYFMRIPEVQSAIRKIAQ